MSEILQDLSEAALINVIEQNHFELFRLFRYWSQAEVHDDPEMLSTITEIPFYFFNNILYTHLSPDKVEEVIEKVKACYASRHVPFRWLVGPSTQPTNLGEILGSHGFIKEGETPGMAVDLQAMNDVSHTPDDLVIEQVRNVDQLRQWYLVLKAAYGLPDCVDQSAFDLFTSLMFNASRKLCFYLGRLGGKPVATSFFILGAGVAGIYYVGSIPELRKQGIGTELTLAALRAAREFGYRIGILRSSEMGYSVYARIGFRKHCNLDEYRWEPA